MLTCCCHACNVAGCCRDIAHMFVDLLLVIKMLQAVVDLLFMLHIFANLLFTCCLCCFWHAGNVAHICWPLFTCCLCFCWYAGNVAHICWAVVDMLLILLAVKVQLEWPEKFVEELLLSCCRLLTCGGGCGRRHRMITWPAACACGRYRSASGCPWALHLS